MVVGNRHASAVDLVSLSGLERGQPLLTISLRRVSDDLLRHPWVKAVSLSRRLPHTLAIEVLEREEVAWMADPSGDGCLVVGEGGVIVSDDCARAASLVELRGAVLSGDGVATTVASDQVPGLLDAVRRGELATLGARVLDVGNQDSVELETGSGVRVLLGDIDHALSRLDCLAALCRSLHVEDYEVIDLRFGGEATLAPR